MSDVIGGVSSHRAMFWIGTQRNKSGNVLVLRLPEEIEQDAPVSLVLFRFVPVELGGAARVFEHAKVIQVRGRGRQSIDETIEILDLINTHVN